MAGGDWNGMVEESGLRFAFLLECLLFDAQKVTIEVVQTGD